MKLTLKFVMKVAFEIRYHVRKFDVESILDVVNVISFFLMRLYAVFFDCGKCISAEAVSLGQAKNRWQSRGAENRKHSHERARSGFPQLPL